MKSSKFGALNSKARMKFGFILIAVFWSILLTLLSLPLFRVHESTSHLIGHGGILLLGLLAIYISYRNVIKGFIQKELIEEELEQTYSGLSRAELVAGFGSWEFDLTTGKVNASTGARTIYGLIEGDITIPIAQAIPLPEYRNMMNKALDDLISSNTPYDLEFKIRRQTDGAIIDVHSVASYDREAKRVFGVIQDITERKKIEDSLRASEQKFRNYIKYAPDGIFVADAKGRYVEVNDQASVVTGYTREELVGMNFIDLIAPEDREKAYSHYRMAAENGYSSGDLQYISKSGEKRWWTVNGARLNENLFLGFVRDISEQKRASEDLRRNESLLRKVLDIIPIGLWIADKNGKLLVGNPAGIKIWGGAPYVDQEHYGVFKARRLPSGEEIRPEDWSLAHSVNDGVTTVNELLEIDAFDGARKIILNFSAPVLDNNGNVEAAIVVNQDITDIKNQEAALRESEEKYRFMTENIEDVIWRQDPDLTFSYISPSDKKQRGFEASEVIGRKIWDFLTPDSAELVRKKFENRLRHLEEHRELGSAVYEVEQYRKDGSTIWTEMISNPIIDQHGALMGFQGVTRDISERKRAENERLDMERRLLHAQKLESLGILSGGIAHDFNNLLTVILGNLEIALMDLDDMCSSRSHIEKAIKAAQRSADLTRQMLAYSGKGAFIIRNVDLSKLIHEYAHMFKTAVSRNIELRLRLEENLPCVKADIGQIQQIVMNLMTNASEAIGSRAGTVTVSTGVMLCDDVCLQKSLLVQKPAPGRFVWLEVEDTGCGMDDETVAKLFDPFFTTKFTGRGLGMSAVLGIVQGHGGAIIVETEVGCGTKIRVMFPSSEQVEIAQEDQKCFNTKNSQPSGSDHRRPVILIVDDDVEICELTSKNLTRMGYVTQIAENGKKAMEIFRQNPESFDLIILDLTMPEMDGEQTFYEMKAIRPDIKIIVCSGYSKQEVAKRIKGLAPDNIMKKPFDMETLRSQIGLFLQ